MDRHTSTLHERNDLHVARKVWHATSGSLMALGFLTFPRDVTVVATACLFVACVVTEFARQRVPSVNRIFLDSMGPIMRRQEQREATGTAWFIGGALFALLFYPKSVAVLAVLHLSIGDPIASFFGIVLGPDVFLRTRSTKKSFIGTIGSHLFCTITTLVYLELVDVRFASVVSRLAFSVLVGWGSAIAEIVPLGLNDNLVIPVAGGAWIWLCSLMFDVLV